MDEVQSVGSGVAILCKLIKDGIAEAILRAKLRKGRSAPGPHVGGSKVV